MLLNHYSPWKFSVIACVTIIFPRTIKKSLIVQLRPYRPIWLAHNKLRQRLKAFKKTTHDHAPTGQLYVSLGQRPRKRSQTNTQALKGRSKLCRSHSQKTPSTSFSLLRKGDHSLQTPSEQTFIPIWQRFLKIWNAQPSSSTLLKTMSTFSSSSTERLHSLPLLETLKSPPQNGLKPKHHIWSFSHGKQVSGRFPLANRIFPLSENTSRIKKSITERSRSKMNYVRFWKSMGWNMMNGISGIRSPFQGLGSLVNRKPRVLPWAGIGDTVSVFPPPSPNTKTERNHAPTGQLYVSLGHRPRNNAPHITQALKGRNKKSKIRRFQGLSIRTPFQGLGSSVDRQPRVLPWADIGDTVGVFLPPNLKLAS